MVALAAFQLMACGPQNDAELQDKTEVVAATSELSFAEFKKQTYRETFEGGLYIVDSDIPVATDEELYEFYLGLHSPDGALTLNTSRGVDNPLNKYDLAFLRYCVSNEFGARKAAAVEAMRQATDLGWEKYGKVNFVYVPSEDGNCVSTNSSLLFAVRPVSGQRYLARAFFPNSAPADSNILIDTAAFTDSTPLKNILTHEVGHVLGFRHEHTRHEAGTNCLEDYNWRAITTYDSASVMHYPQCGGTGTPLTLSERDKAGVAKVYGPATGYTPPALTPPPVFGNKTLKVTASSPEDTNTMHDVFGLLTVKPGTQFSVIMTGTGNADLYVKFGSMPTKLSQDCRPIKDGSAESCVMQVPAGATNAFVGAVARTAVTVTITATWTQ